MPPKKGCDCGMKGKSYAKMEKMIKDDKKEKGLKEGSKKDMKKDALMIAVMVGKPKKGKK